ncbi:MAG: HAD-IA family hydrolase [Actinomycetota bacterium]|nr:HAD-IA family hydrolase [Actinomycetota bacterium]
MPDRSPYKGLVVDFGGVLTTHLGDAFRAFCEREGVDYERVRAKLREAYGESDPESLVARFETGRIEREDFERELAAGLSEGLHRPIDASDLIRRMMTDVRLDDAMVAAAREARRRGVRTALLSNSWGVEYYPHDLLAELFDEVVISGQVGLRKPDPQVFRLAAERLGLEPNECLFVDDVRGNIEAGERVGMRGVLHENTSRTVAELERLLGLPLSEVVDTL